MTPLSDFRERLAAVFSLAVGVAVATSMVGLSLKSAPAPVSKAIRVSHGVRFGAPPAAPVAPVPRAAVPIQTPDAPKQKPKKAPVQPPQPPTVDTPPAPVAEAPVIEASGSTALAQPKYPGVTTATPTADLPMLPGQVVANNGQSKPPAPADDYTPPPQEYLERPGGEVLVLGVLVDQSGKVLKAQVLVPSWDDLKNYTLAIVAKDLTLSEVDPPLTAGETRWLEVRYVIPQHKPGLLP